MMKSIFRNVILFPVICCLLFGMIACAKMPGSSTESGKNSGVLPIGDYAAAVGRKDGYMSESAGPMGGSSGQTVAAGQMTAGAWDDNADYDLWRGLFEKGQTSEDSGKFVFYAATAKKLSTENRLEVNVVNDGQPVAGAKVVSCDPDGNVTFSAVTNAVGVAYLFPSNREGSIRAASGEFEQTIPMPADNAPVQIALGGAEEKQDLIEIMFVVDVTGSMGDEISYLQAELGDVIRQVAESNAAAQIRLSFLFYRDHGDQDIFTFVDFRDVTESKDYEIQQKELAKQFASGGGDYEEAMDEAMEIAVSKQWSVNSTKLIFLVLDAPIHSGEEYEGRYANAVATAAGWGIRICPVLASGADTFCEYLTRSAAVLTGGTFVFLTDDSGIGGEHLDPELPNAVIEYLNACLVRLINGYHTGTFADPVPWNAQ